MGYCKAGLFMILCCLASKTCFCEFGQFNGGSLSFMVVNGTTGFEIQLDVISGWVLGLGPCGLNCSRASINSDTRQTREEVMRKENSRYFGNWKMEYKLNGDTRTTHNNDINDHVYNTMVQKVIDVSEKGKWEQDWMVVRISMISRATYVDISFEGQSWRSLSLQGENKGWHLQVKVKPDLRSDTGKPNNSPQAFSKPIYRVLLEQEKHIRVATLDPDGDFVNCKLAEYVEAGYLSSHRLPNVTVTEDCMITVPSKRSLGYHNGSWGAIAVTIRDWKDASALSAIGLQFLVQFLDDFNEPKFIYQTPEDNHRFNIYSGTTWKIDLFAEPISPALIDHFSYVGRQRENLTFIDVKNTFVPNHANVKKATLMWRPLESEIGGHIVCVNVEDSVGMDSSDQRCYLILVKPSYNMTQPTNIPTDKPYFINVPDKDVLWCDVNATCIFPVYAKTPNPGANITSIWIGKYFLDSAENDTKIETSDTGIGKMDIHVRHASDGSPSLCLYAKDSTGAVSNETCINPRMMPPDPCLKRPCKYGTCKRNTDDLSQFYCQCLSNHYYGKFCEKEKDDCPPHRCLHGTCVDRPGEWFLCNCSYGWTGQLCDNPKSSCRPEYCNQHGDCKNEVYPNYSCDCFQRYNGSTCLIDKCPLTFHDDKTCSEQGCNATSCSNNGVCTEGGICHCGLGFEGSLDCTSSKGNLSNQQVNFVEPTPLEGSVITCFNSKPCSFSVFIAGGSDPVVGIQYISDDLKNVLHVSTPEEVKYVPGIQNMLESLIKIDAPPAKTYLGQQYVCIEAHTRISVGSSRRCFNIFYINEPTILPYVGQKLKFVDPTPNGNSRFICKVNTTCHFFVYTNQDNTSNCHDVVSFSGVFVQPVKSKGSNCFTDVSYSFSNEGHRSVCLKADDKDGERRCFTIDIIGPCNDPCLSNPCQNTGICLRKDNSTFKCICGEEYTGSNCERGPCLSTVSTCQHGYCEVNNITQTCFCSLGYKGTKCENAIPDEVKDLHNNVSVFTDTFIPKELVCAKNKPCVIPFVVSGNYPFPSKPTVDIGYVSPSIKINGIEPLEKKNSTNGTYTSEIMFTPTVPGKQKMCIQTLSPNRINLDEICFNVDVKPDSSFLFGEKDKPHFTPPSITQNSTVVCKTGVTCHMMFKVSSGRANENNCSSMKLVEGLKEYFHIFSDCETCTDGPTAVNNCTMDLVFNPSTSNHGIHHLCLEARLMWREMTGEIRCFDIEVVDENSNVNGPCTRLHCKNGGFCDAENAGSGQPVCHCPIGYYGTTCETDESTSISNNTNRPSVGNLALPVEINCNYNESCFIPFQLLGQPPDIPFVEPGHVPPTIAVEKLFINGTDSTGKQFEGYLKIRPMGNGTQHVCIQSKASSSTTRVLEEICFKVLVGGGQFTGPPVDKSRPYYIDPTLPDRSTVLCKTGSACHILMYTSNTSSNCPTVSEIQDYTDGLHIFLAASRHGYDCVTDISYIPPTAIQGQKKTVCLQVSLPGFRGEVRCYGVISLDKANLSTGLCMNKDCKNGGHCESSSQEARCVCRLGYGGDECTGTSKNVDPSPIPQVTDSPVFTDLAIPDTLICYIGIECWLPVIVNGNGSPNKPTLTFGHVDSGLTPGTHMLDSGTVRGVYSGNVSFIPSALGQYSLCVQTADPTNLLNIDEVCCTVMVDDTSCRPTQPPFQTPTLNANSTVKCQVNTTCHILTYLDPENGQCPELSQTSAVENIFVFSPDTTEGKCAVDTAFTPSSNQMGINTICMKTRNNDNTRCIDVRVVEKINVATSSTTTETTTMTRTPSMSQTTTVSRTAGTTMTVTSLSTMDTTTRSLTTTPMPIPSPTLQTSTSAIQISKSTTTSPSITVTSQTTSATFKSTTSQPAAATMATSTTVATSHTILPTSQSMAASQKTETTTFPSTTVMTQSTFTSPSPAATSQSETQMTAISSTATMTSHLTVPPSQSSTVNSPSTQATFMSTASTSQPAALTTATSTTVVTSESTLLTSQSTATSPSTTVMSQSTSTTSLSLAAVSQSETQTTATSSTTTMTSLLTLLSSQSSTVNSHSTQESFMSTAATTQPAAETKSTTVVTSESTLLTSQSMATSQSTSTTTSPSTTVTSQQPTLTTSTLPAATSQPETQTTATSSTKMMTSLLTVLSSQSSAVNSPSTQTTFMSTVATSQPAAVTTTTSTILVTSESTLPTSQSTATSQSASTTTSPSTTVMSQPTLTTPTSPAATSQSETQSRTTSSTTMMTSLLTVPPSQSSAVNSPSTQTTFMSTVATSQPATVTTTTSTILVTSESTLPTSQSMVTSQSTSTTTSPSTTVTSQQPTLTTSTLPAATSQPETQTTATSSTKMMTSLLTVPSSQSSAVNSPSTQTTFMSTVATSQPAAVTTTTSTILVTSESALPTSQSTATSQSASTTTSPSTTVMSQPTLTTPTSPAATSQSETQSRTTSSTTMMTSLLTVPPSQSSAVNSPSTQTTFMSTVATSQPATVTTTTSTILVTSESTLPTSQSMATSQSTSTTTSPSTTVTSQQPTLTTSTLPAATSQPETQTTATSSTKMMTSLLTVPSSQSSAVNSPSTQTTFMSTVATSQPAAVTTTTSTILVTSESTLPTSQSTATSQSASTTTSPSTTVMSQPTLTTPTSPAATSQSETQSRTTSSTTMMMSLLTVPSSQSSAVNSPSTQTTFMSTVATSQPAAVTTTTSTILVTSESTLPTSQSASTTTSPSTTVMSQPTLTTPTSPAATSQSETQSRTTSSTTMMTSLLTVPPSQSSAVNSPSTQTTFMSTVATSQPAAATTTSTIVTSQSTLPTSQLMETSQSTATTTSPSTTVMSQPTLTTSTSPAAIFTSPGTLMSTAATSQQAGTSQTTESTISTTESGSSTAASTTTVSTTSPARSSACSEEEKKAASERARELANAGRISCFCNVTQMVNGQTITKRIEVIRPRSAVTTTQLAKAGAAGAGGMVGTMAAVGISAFVFKKLKNKMGEKKKVSPRPKSRAHLNTLPK